MVNVEVTHEEEIVPTPIGGCRMKPAEAEVLREYAEKLAGERFPEADKISANVSHQDGPVVEVKQGKTTTCHRLTGYEV